MRCLSELRHDHVQGHETCVCYETFPGGERGAQAAAAAIVIGDSLMAGIECLKASYGAMERTISRSLDSPRPTLEEMTDAVR